MLPEMYGKDAMSCTRAFEWHRRFREGKEDVEDEERLERPNVITITINNNIEKETISERRPKTDYQIDS